MRLWRWHNRTRYEYWPPSVVEEAKRRARFLTEPVPEWARLSSDTMFYLPCSCWLCRLRVWLGGHDENWPRKGR